jgi:hypothetical protein
LCLAVLPNLWSRIRHAGVKSCQEARAKIPTSSRPVPLTSAQLCAVHPSLVLATPEKCRHEKTKTQAGLTGTKGPGARVRREARLTPAIRRRLAANSPASSDDDPTSSDDDPTSSDDEWTSSDDDEAFNGPPSSDDEQIPPKRIRIFINPPVAASLFDFNLVTCAEE